MKKNSKRILVLLLVFTMAFTGFPATSFAADDEPVLVDIDWNGQNSSDISGNNIAVEVPYNFGITFDTGNPSSHQVSNATNPEGGPLYTGVSLSGGIVALDAAAGATASGDLVASYTHNVTSGSAINSISTYTVTVTRAARQNPTFTGSVNIRKTLAAGYTFSASDFTEFYDANDGGALAFISISTVAGGSAGVTLMYDNALYVENTLIAMSAITAGRLRIAASSAGTATYTVSGYEVGNSTTPYGNVSVHVDMLSDNIIETSAAGAISQLSTAPISIPKDDMNAKFTAKIGESIEQVKFTLPSSTQGILYKEYPKTVVSAGMGYSLNVLENVVFVPNREYSGTVNIAYKAYDADGNEFTGVITIIVAAEAYSVTAQTATVKQTETLFLKNTNVATAFATAAGAALNSVKFILPDETQGTLYRNYVSASNPGTAVVQGTEYSLTDYNTISFVPKSTYIGNSVIYYTGKDAAGNSFNGKLTLTIKAASVAEIALSVAQDEVSILSSSTLNTKFKAASGTDFSYLKFTLPPISYGALYYGYSSSSSPGTAVRATDMYYRIGTGKQLDDVALVPKSTYTGTFTIDYIGYTASGEAYPGTIKVTVTGSTSDIATLSYSVEQGAKLLLSTTDINNAFKAEVGSSLSYVKFTLPSSTYGVLYYNYTSTGSYDAKVSASTKYYRSGDTGVNLLSLVSFVPKSTYSGTFAINYVAYDTSNNDYSGKIQVNVKSGSEDIQLLTYNIDQDEVLTFSSADFNENFQDAASSTSFSYIQFTLPASTYGILYYDYISATKPGTAVRASDKYYRTGTSNKLFADVSFVPKSGYTGSFTLTYTAYDSSGNSFVGKVSITVGTNNIKTLTYSITNGEVLTFSDTEINTVFKQLADTSFSYLKFTLPSTTTGKLYHEYESSEDLGTAVSASTKYYRSSEPYVDDVSFVPKSTYTGTFELKYVAYDSDNENYSGVIKVTVTVAEQDTSDSKYFNDVQNHWAAGFIDYLYAEDIVTGVTSTTFSPSSNITRGDFMLMLYRAFNLKGSTTSNFSDVPKSSYYYNAIAIAKALGIAQGSDSGKYYPKASITRQDAVSLLYRTMTATGQSVTGATSQLNKFSDKSSIATYSQVGIAALVAKEIIDGYPNGTFKPLGNMTRAEMAAVLYKVELL